MATDLHALDAWATGLLAQLAPVARKTLARQIATELRRRQQARIAAQVNPDGTPFEPRKPQFRRKTGRIRRQMFAKLRTGRWLKTQATADSAIVEFAAGAQRIARVHHYGLRDRVEKDGPIVKYSARELLGISEADYDALADVLLVHLGK